MRRIVWLILLIASGPAKAAEIRVLTAGAFKPVVSEILPEFERRTGHRVQLANDTAGALVRRIEEGEPFDLVMLTPTGIEELGRKGRITGASTPLARVGIGVAVKAGTPRPNIATTEAFRDAVAAAPSIAYIDPAAGGSSGIYLDRLFARLGIADAVRAKAVLVPGGLVAERVVRGEAVLGIHQISEILAVPGADLVGPLPPDIQNYTVYAGGIAATSIEKEAVGALLATLAGEDGRAVLARKGMEPAHP
jgi:molybdate transport system substrate-binding protein